MLSSDVPAVMSSSVLMVDLTGDSGDEDDEDRTPEPRQRTEGSVTEPDTVTRSCPLRNKRPRDSEGTAAEVTVISSDDDEVDGETTTTAASLQAPPSYSPLDRLLALPIEPGSIFDTLASSASRNCSDVLKPAAAKQQAKSRHTSSDFGVQARHVSELQQPAVVQETAGDGDSTDFSPRSNATVVTRSGAADHQYLHGSLSTKSNVFVARTQASRSAFYRGPSSAQVQRRERMDAKGLVIQRLPPDGVITDEGSIFDSFVVVHPDLSTDDVRDCVDEVRSDERVCRAAHPSIHAYRLNTNAPSSGCSSSGVETDGRFEGRRAAALAAVLEGSDDDGEQFASEKILRVLRDAKLTGVLVIVTRWFGGRLLGPRRFTHITVVAKRVLERNGYVAPP